MGAVGRQHIEENFSLDLVIARWSGLLNQLVRAAA
jgi:hypothetical protein